MQRDTGSWHSDESWEWSRSLNEPPLDEPHFDRFDICEAYHVFHMDWHSGGIVRELDRRVPIPYQLHQMQFRMSPLSGRLTANGQAIYNQLVDRAGFSMYYDYVPVNKEQ